MVPNLRDEKSGLYPCGAYMIDYDNDDRTMVMECDVCEQALEMYGEFVECIQEAKDNNWKIFKSDDDQWEHYCPRCWANHRAEGVFE
jgi:hypothetical protein